MNIELSVVIPVYNEEQGLAALLLFSIATSSS